MEVKTDSVVFANNLLPNHHICGAFILNDLFFTTLKIFRVIGFVILAMEKAIG